MVVASIMATVVGMLYTHSYYSCRHNSDSSLRRILGTMSALGYGTALLLIISTILGGI